jgi:8-oxo-dGTP pyrophosphatase MutT (NUDIX family)
MSEFEFEWTDGYKQKHWSNRFKNMSYVFLDGSVGKQIRIPPTFKIDPTYKFEQFEREFLDRVFFYDELLIETTDPYAFRQFLTILEHIVQLKRLTFRGVTFASHSYGDSSTRLPRCEFLKFVNCTFEQDTFTPHEWGKIENLIFRDTFISEMQEDSKNDLTETINIEGSNEYLLQDFQFGFHFPRIKRVEMKNVGEFYLPLTSTNVSNVQRWMLKGDVQPVTSERGFDTTALRKLKKFYFAPDDPSDETDAFAYAVLNNIVADVEKVSVKCKKCGQFLTLRGRTGLDSNEFKILDANGNPYAKKTSSNKQLELERLVGKEGGHYTFHTEDPRGAQIRYARGADPFDDAIFEADFQQHLTDLRNVNDYDTVQDNIPQIFRDTARYIHGLSEDQKRAIYLYTSGKDSRVINEFLLDRIPQAELHDVQLRAMNTLVKDVFPHAPVIQSPFVVFRGYPMTKLDDGAFHSSTVRADVLKSDWYTKFDRRSLAVRPVKSEATTGCCIHVIRVMPGARVLYFQSRWAGITAYGEYEVLFAPHMGTFHHLRSSKVKETNLIHHDWVYVPEGVPVGNKRTLEERFNQMNVRVNAPHPDVSSSEGLMGYIRVPSTPTKRATHTDPNAVARFVPKQSKLPYVSSKLTPAKLKLLTKLSKDVPHFDDGEAAGTIIFEPDGRLWIVHPTNKFMGYTSTFPKGTRDGNEDLRKTAIRETYEETGLLVSLIAYPGVCYGEGVNNGAFVRLDRAAGATYYYLAKREGGSPSDMGWESQAVSLVPVSELRAQKIGKRYVSLSNWDEALLDDDAPLQPDDYLSQDSRIVNHIIDQADVIQALF